MIKFDLNRLSIAGLLIGVAAGVLLVLGLALDWDLSLGGIFGPGVPWAQMPVYLVVALLGLMVYGVGRVIWLVKNRFGLPPGPRRP